MFVGGCESVEECLYNLSETRATSFYRIRSLSVLLPMRCVTQVTNMCNTSD